MKVLICGDRNWDDRDTIYRKMAGLAPDTIVIVGGAKGADFFAEKIAKELNLSYIVFRAKWNLYGKRAGPIRNIQMLDQGPDKVIAFHKNLSNSKGTRHCVTEALQRGIPVEVVSD